MEILTALQWAKKGFIPNEGTEGTEQWTNCYYSSKAVYFKDCEVHEDKEAAKAILSAKRKEYRDVAKKREEKRKQNRSEERRVGKECRSRWSPYH